MVSHEWAMEDGTKKWFSGHVTSVIDGKDGDQTTVYEVKYKGDSNLYSVDLFDDYMNGSLKFTDV